MQWFALLVLYGLVLIFVSSHSVKKVSSKQTNKLPGKTIHTKAHAIKYLTRFGYNPCESLSVRNSTDHNRSPCKSSLESMLEQFQTKFNLPVTKKLDAATRKMMNIPRCGMSDSPLPFVNSSNLWSTNRTLKWKLDSDPFASGSLETRKYIQQAFDDWADHTGLIFQEVIRQEKPDFHLAFVYDDHGDGYPLDGALSHAFYPWAITNRGQIHLSRNQEWSNTYDNAGINMRLVASHAIGHSLGLTHSYTTHALMNPLYQVIQPKDMLPTEDQNRVRSLYQKKSIWSIFTATQSIFTTKSTTSRNGQGSTITNDKQKQKMSRKQTGNVELNNLIEQLHIHGSQIEDDALGNLADAIRWKLNIHTISLVLDNNGENVATKLADIIRWKSSIHTVRLALSNLGDNAVAKLADVLRWSSDIHTINLALNNISDNAVGKLVDAIRWNSKNPNITLALSNLSDNAVAKFADFIRWNSNIPNISLALSSLGDKAVDKLADAIRWNSNIHNISLALSNLSDKAVAKFADVLRWSSNIKNFSLALSTLGDKAVDTLADVIRWKSDIHTINLVVDNLSNNAVAKLADVIRWKSNIHTIILAISNLGDDAVGKLADVIRWKSDVDKIILSMSHLTDNAVAKVADVLRWNSNSHNISLAISNLGDGAMGKLSDVIRWKSNIGTIYLAVDNINDKAVEKLADAIRWNSNIRNISLALNNIGDNGARKLADAIRYNSNIKRFNFKHNQIETYGPGVTGLFSVKENENTTYLNNNQKSSSTLIKQNTTGVEFFNRYFLHRFNNIYNFPMNYHNWIPYLDYFN